MRDWALHEAHEHDDAEPWAAAETRGNRGDGWRGRPRRAPVPRRDVRTPASPGMMSFRTVLPSFPGDPHYVFVVYSPDSGVAPGAPAWDEYREQRRIGVHQYAIAAMGQFDDAMAVVGIATEGSAVDGALFPRSFDLVVIARQDWTADHAELARELQAMGGWFQDVRWSRGREDEYPNGPPTIGRVFEPRP